MLYLRKNFVVVFHLTDDSLRKLSSSRHEWGSFEKKNLTRAVLLNRSRSRTSLVASSETTISEWAENRKTSSPADQCSSWDSDLMKKELSDEKHVKTQDRRFITSLGSRIAPPRYKVFENPRLFSGWDAGCSAGGRGTRELHAFLASKRVIVFANPIGGFDPSHANELFGRRLRTRTPSRSLKGPWVISEARALIFPGHLSQNPSASDHMQARLSRHRANHSGKTADDC